MPTVRQKKTMISLMCLSACALMAAAPPIVRAADAVKPMEPSGAVEMVLSEDPKDFYESAASANMLEIEASKLAETKSTDADVKAFAAMMIKDHTAAGQKLGKLATTKKVVLPTQLLKRHQMMLDGLKEEENGADFDKEYRMKMVMSHKEAVSLFDHASKKSPDPDIRAFATEMLPKLQEHGAHAKKMEDAAKKKPG
jgi:putative membrane protein